MEKKISAKEIVMNLDIIVASAALVVLVVLTFLGVIMRYLVGQPFTWMEELQLFCMVWIVFAAGGRSLSDREPCSY